jgi:UDP:flavonoid glycosyltransferase YjiC (YdhE family)
VRVLFSSTSGLGHVQPMLPLATALQAAGHDVRWATGESACGTIAAVGITAVPVGLSDAERMATFLERHPEAAAMTGEDRATFMFPRLFGGVAAPAAVGGLVELTDAWRPDLIVHEQAELAAPAVAAALGVPNVCHGFGFAVPPERVALAGELAAPAWAHVGVAPRPFGGCFDHLYIDVYPRSLQPEELPHLGRRVHRRPESTTAAPGDRLDDAVQARLTDRPLVYLTFGTTFNVNPTFARALDGLAGLDVEVVATVGPSGDPAALGPQPDHVHVTHYVPQSHLLPHVDVVASHAGSGTFLATMAAGLPQLCLPQAADQFRNGAACEGAGAGLTLAGEAATADAIGEAVERLLDDPTFRTGAGRLAEEIASMPSPAELVPVLEELAAAPPT